MDVVLVGRSAEREVLGALRGTIRFALGQAGEASTILLLAAARAFEPVAHAAYVCLLRLMADCRPEARQCLLDCRAVFRAGR